MIYKNRGFTLIELLLVVAIISLLSSIFFYNTTEAKKKAEDAHMKAEAGSVATAIELYKLDNDGRVPNFSNTSLRGRMVREGDSDTGDEYVEAMQELVDGGYLSEIPRSPSGGSYAYMTTDEDEPQSAVFVSHLNLDDEVCKISGEDDFDQTGGGDSCDGILADGDDGGEEEVGCGEPPYVNSRTYTDVINYGGGSVDISAEVDMVDPEGEIVYMTWDYFSFYPNSGRECGISTSSNLVQCSFYGVDYAFVSFGMQTEGCPVEYGEVYLEYGK